MFYWQSSHTNKISLLSSTPAQLLCDHKLHGPEHCTQPSTDSQYLPRQNRQGVLSSPLSDIAADRFFLVREAFDVFPFDFFETATCAIFLFCSTAITEFAMLLSMIMFSVDCDATGESAALLSMITFALDCDTTGESGTLLSMITFTVDCNTSGESAALLSMSTFAVDCDTTGESEALLSMITFAVDCNTTGESAALLLMREAVVVFPLVNFFVTATLAPRESAAFALITGSAVIPESVQKKSSE